MRTRTTTTTTKKKKTTSNDSLIKEKTKKPSAPPPPPPKEEPRSKPIIVRIRLPPKAAHVAPPKTDVKSPEEKTPQKQQQTPQKRGAPNFDDKTLEIALREANPKRPDTMSYHRYEAYKKAKTTGEYLTLGGSRADLLYDYKRGFLEVAGHGAAPQSTPQTSRFPGTSRRRESGEEEEDDDNRQDDDDDDPAFWDKPIGAKCKVLHSRVWYPATFFKKTSDHAIVNYDRYKGISSLVDLDDERHRIRWL